MKKATGITKVAVIAGLIFVGLVWSHPADPESDPAQVEPLPAPELAMPPMELMSLPNLTDAQREQIQSLQIKHLKEVLPIRTDLRIKKMELALLWQAEKLDEKQIVAKVKEISELRKKLELAKANHQMAIYKTLTPEQRKAFRSGFGMGKWLRGRRGRAKFWQGWDRPGAMPRGPHH